MKYLCLVYYDENNVDSMTRDEWKALVNRCFDYGDGIRNTGHFLGGEALQSVKTATTLRVRQGKVSTTDGPFAETREQLAGFYLIEARDMDEAVQVASNIPPATFGSIEIRPIKDLLASIS